MQDVPRPILVDEQITHLWHIAGVGATLATQVKLHMPLPAPEALGPGVGRAALP